MIKFRVVPAAALLAAVASSVSFSPSVVTINAQQIALSPVREIPVAAGTPSGQPFLAADASGRIALSWLERLDQSGRYAFRYSVRQAEGWSAPKTVVERDSFFVNWADVPSIHPIAGRGGFVAHWLQRNGAGTYAYDVRLAMSDAKGATWSADRLPYTDSSQTEHGFASFFDWPGGGTGLIWLDGREMKSGGHDGHGVGAMTLRAARVGHDGSITGETRLDARVCECCPTAAVATRSAVVVAYRDRSEAEIRDIAVMRLEGGRWSGPTVVQPDNWQVNACPVNGPALAAERDRVAIAWFTAEGNKPRAMVAFSNDAGKTFGRAIRVDEAQTIGRVDVVMLGDGRAIVSWLEVVAGGAELRGRFVSADGTRSPHFVVASSSADRQGGYPRMVRSGNDLVFAWTATRPALQVKTAVVTIGS